MLVSVIKIMNKAILAEASLAYLGLGDPLSKAGDDHYPCNGFSEYLPHGFLEVVARISHSRDGVYRALCCGNR